MEVTPALIRVAHDKHHAATTVLLASRWLADHPDDRSVMLDYAEMLYRMTRYEDAIRAYRGALDRVDDEDARWAIYNQLGRLYQY